MRLTELDPRWLVRDGQRVGFVFRTPTRPEKCWQSCFLAAPPFREQCKLIAAAFDDWDDEDREYGRPDVQTCKEGTHWTIDGEFENLTCRPSLDGSPGGNWHGFITDGEIVGGL